MANLPDQRQTFWMLLAIATTLGAVLPALYVAWLKYHPQIIAYASRYQETLRALVQRSAITVDSGTLAQQLARFVAFSHKAITPPRLIGGSIITIALGLVSGTPLQAGLLVFLLHVLPVILTMLQSDIEQRRVELVEEAIPDMCGVLSSALSAGMPLRNATALVSENMKGPISTEFKIMTNNLAAGSTMREALEGLNNRVPSKYVALFAAAALVNIESGGNLGQVLQDMGSSFTRIFLSEAEVRAKTAGSRREALLASVVPLAILPLMFLMMPELAHILFQTVPGLLILLVAGIIYQRNLREVLRVSNQEV